MSIFFKYIRYTFTGFIPIRPPSITETTELRERGKNDLGGKIRSFDLVRDFEEIMEIL